MGFASPYPNPFYPCFPFPPSFGFNPYYPANNMPTPQASGFFQQGGTYTYVPGVGVQQNPTIVPQMPPQPQPYPGPAVQGRPHTYRYVPPPQPGQPWPNLGPLPPGSSYYFGTPAAQAQANEYFMAARNGANNPIPIEPKDAKPSQQFWVRELNGTWIVRNYAQIKRYTGHWNKGPIGELHFIKSSS